MLLLMLCYICYFFVCRSVCARDRKNNCGGGGGSSSKKKIRIAAVSHKCVLIDISQVDVVMNILITQLLWIGLKSFEWRFHSKSFIRVLSPFSLFFRSFSSSFKRVNLQSDDISVCVRPHHCDGLGRFKHKQDKAILQTSLTIISPFIFIATSFLWGEGGGWTNKNQEEEERQKIAPFAFIIYLKCVDFLLHTHTKASEIFVQFVESEGVKKKKKRKRIVKWANKYDIIVL